MITGDAETQALIARDMAELAQQEKEDAEVATFKEEIVDWEMVEVKEYVVSVDRCRCLSQVERRCAAVARFELHRRNRL